MTAIAHTLKARRQHTGSAIHDAYLTDTPDRHFWQATLLSDDGKVGDYDCADITLSGIYAGRLVLSPLAGWRARLDTGHNTPRPARDGDVLY